MGECRTTQEETVPRRSQKDPNLVKSLRRSTDRQFKWHSKERGKRGT